MAEPKETKPDIKPDVRPISQHVKVVVSGMDGRKITVKIKRNVPLGEAMKLYAETFHMPLQKLRFLHDGVRISSVTTPLELNMDEDKEHNTIEVFWEQEAGH